SLRRRSDRRRGPRKSRACWPRSISRSAIVGYGIGQFKRALRRRASRAGLPERARPPARDALGLATRFPLARHASGLARFRRTGPPAAGSAEPHREDVRGDLLPAPPPPSVDQPFTSSKSASTTSSFLPPPPLPPSPPGCCAPGCGPPADDDAFAYIASASLCEARDSSFVAFRIVSASWLSSAFLASAIADSTWPRSPGSMLAPCSWSDFSVWYT